jgi:AcrR family transcriptional regulator
MATETAHTGASAGSATQRQFTKMQERVADQELAAGPADRELTEMKQQQIIDGASKVLFERGFHRTSIRDIAAACDMSMGQLYHYISSKDDILYLMHRHSQQQWYKHLVDAGFEELTDATARLEHGLRISIMYLSENRDLMQFLYSETKYLDQEHLKSVLELDDQNVVGFYRHLLSEIPGDPGHGNDDLAANLIAFICVFLSLRGWNLHFSSATDVDAAVDYLVDFIFRGLGIERGTIAEEAPA